MEHTLELFQMRAHCILREETEGTREHIPPPLSTDTEGE